MKTATFKGYLDKIPKESYIFFAAIMWSLVGLIIRNATVGPFWICVLRNGVPGILLLPFCHARKLIKDPHVILACLSYSLFMFSFVLATRIAGPAQAVAGQYMAPLFVFLLGLIRKQVHLNWKNLLAMGSIAIGMIIMIVSGLKSSPIVLLIPFACGILFPVYTETLKKAEKYSSFDLMALANLCCGLLFLPFALIFTPNEIPNLTPGNILYLGFVGLIINWFSYCVYGKGVEKVPTLNVMIICLIEPIMNPIWVYLFLGEAQTLSTIVALAFIIGGAVINLFIYKSYAKEDSKTLTDHSINIESTDQKETI